MVRRLADDLCYRMHRKSTRREVLIAGVVICGPLRAAAGPFVAGLNCSWWPADFGATHRPCGVHRGRDAALRTIRITAGCRFRDGALAVRRRACAFPIIRAGLALRLTTAKPWFRPAILFDDELLTALKSIAAAFLPRLVRRGLPRDFGQRSVRAI